MNEWEAKQQAKRERFADLAKRHRERAETASGAAMSILDNIPPGQPILVGHHSEKRHRADLSRVDRQMAKSTDHRSKADYYDGKAESTGTAGISSDDPSAAGKLRAKVARLESDRDKMKAINAAWRKAGKPSHDGGESAIEAWRKVAEATGLSKDGLSRLLRRIAITPYDPVPYPGYSLTNIGAKIRSAKQRLANVEAAPTETVEKTVHGVLVVENAEENRVQVIFGHKPSKEIRGIMKRHGFRWSPTNGAWQRHLNNAGRWAADSALKDAAAITD